jgi:hypothetical protein
VSGKFLLSINCSVSSNGFSDGCPSVHDHAFLFDLYVCFLKFRSEGYSTSSDYLNLWLRQIRDAQNSDASDEAENPILAPEYRDEFDVPVDTQPASSRRKATPTISSSYSDARDSYESSPSMSHSPSSASHSVENERDDESGFLVHSDVDSLSRPNIVTSDGDTLQAADGASHRTLDNAATGNMEGNNSSGRQINQAITDTLIRGEPQSQAHEATGAVDEECELWSDSSRKKQEQRLTSCFICHTTNMSQWIKDPDGVPLCKRLLHLLEL